MALRDYILFTERDPTNWKFYKRQEACDWSAEEFDFNKEKNDYQQAPEPIKKLLKGIFGFFLIGDGLISEDVLVFLQEAIQEKNWPLVYYLSMQLKVENTHAETYSKAALTIVPEEEHEEIFSMCKDLPCIQAKGEWIKKYIDNSKSKALRYVACAVGEGVFFVSLFAVIFYMRKLNLFKNFIESNEQISKDESIHRDQKAEEARKLLTDKDKEEAIKIIKEGVEIEKEHARYLLSYPIMGRQADIDAGFTIENLCSYIEMLADQTAYLCGLDIIYNAQADLPWMEDINLSQKTNFYERDVVGSYRKFNPTVSNEENQEDFLNPEDVDF
jgi:ribonucleotide reductase beta subunit family protein with ferritin-like domain